ncbi:hypothetical protein HYPSUDRAFT_428760 [Hypholoma sublateritium FD-334 SS-4]|uniref:F-box domain-containing protein n=1 Tax=Hypholoma sublateritium (strain FD-334 SS-4) TaxID=945553 RepID=A0A0D2P271_HYPSF|nr:hypothetical protein HYPSUDRAFT_428760 [Hypholoma sublateritium FD-334 SS-4]
MQMPFMEELSLSLARFVRSPPSKINALRPPLPRLKSITFTDADPGVYPAFLDHIIPSACCRLSIQHRLDPWSRLATEESRAEDIAHMHRVMGRYVDSYFDHKAAPVTEIMLMVSQFGFMFRLGIWGEREDFYIGVGYNRIHDSSVNTLRVMLDCLSTYKFSRNIAKLHFISGLYDNSTNHPLSFKVLGSMNAITTLMTDRVGLLYLGRLPHHETLFPRLETISLRLVCRPRGGVEEEGVFQFLFSRHSSVPIKVLDLTSSSWPLADLRFLDTLSGLKVAWKSRSDTPIEYVCGNGDRQQLFLLDDGALN